MGSIDLAVQCFNIVAASGVRLGRSLIDDIALRLIKHSVLMHHFTDIEGVSFRKDGCQMSDDGRRQS